MTAQQNLQLKRIFWFILCLALCASLVAASSLILLRTRALAALKELQLSNIEDSKSAINSKLRNMEFVQEWFKIKGLLKDDYQWVAAGSSIFKQIISHKDITQVKLSELCKAECSEDAYKKLLSSDQQISELQQLENKLEKLAETSSKLTLELNQQLKTHILLAKDFEELVGSPSLYTEAQKSEILFFVSGPFKWLPLLDTTKTTSKPAVIHDFSSRLETLRERSKAIVEEYQALKSREKLVSDEQSSTSDKSKALKNSILQSLLSAWGTEF